MAIARQDGNTVNGTRQDVEKYKTRSLRLDDESWQILLAWKERYGSHNKGIKAMNAFAQMDEVEPNGGAHQNPDFEYRQTGYATDTLDEIAAKENAAESKTFAAFEERGRTVEGGRPGGGISESTRHAIAERRRLDPDAPDLIVGIIENTRGEDFCAECRHEGGGHRGGCSMTKPMPTGPAATAIAALTKHDQKAASRDNWHRGARQKGDKAR